MTVLCLNERRNSKLSKTCISKNSSIKNIFLQCKLWGKFFSLASRKSINHTVISFHQENKGNQCYICKINKNFSNAFCNWGLFSSFWELKSHFLSSYSNWEAIQLPIYPKLCSCNIDSGTQIYHSPKIEILGEWYISCLSHNIWTTKVNIVFLCVTIYCQWTYL